MMRIFFSSLFVLFMSLPVLLGWSPWHGLQTNATKLEKAPGWYLGALVTSDYYTAWRHYIDDRMAKIPMLISAKSWMDAHLFQMTDREDIHVGQDGWLYDRSSLKSFHKNDCEERVRIQEVFTALQTVSGLSQIAGHPVLVSIVPAKSTIYPEHMGPVPQDRICGQSAYDIWLEANAKNPLDEFVRLDDLLVAAKTQNDLLYQKTGTDWSSAGAMVVAKSLMGKLFGPASGEENIEDLATRLMSSATTSRASDDSIAHRSEGRLSSILVYGGSQAAKLLSMVAHRFDRVDRIDSSTIPSLSHHERITDYDAVLILIPESQLADVTIDVDRWCALLSADSLVASRSQVPLTVIHGKRNISVEAGGSLLTIKSMGTNSFFAMPALPGSEERILRLLRLTLEAPWADTLTWTESPAGAGSMRRALRPGNNTLYLPLNRGPSVRLEINPGQRPGIFHLASADVLEYNVTFHRLPEQAGQSRSLGNKSVQGKIVWPAIVPGSLPENHSTASKPSAPPALMLNDFETGRIFQRKGATADLVISGTYTGLATAIEAQVLNFTTQAPVVPWTIIDDTPSNGIFMGLLPEVPQGGWYRMAVRFKGQPDTAKYGQARWGVGMLVALIGQSNMKEWFHSGNDLIPHSLCSLHRDGHWYPDLFQGNGATAFANRLIAKAAVPVGLLDYAVNGSGLCKEADWGTGYWADRSSHSIYQQLIEAVADTGGSLEYVMWMQGEADAARATISERHYRQNLSAFIEQIRKDIINGSSRPQLPFLIIGMPKRPIGADEPHQAVRRAQMAVTRRVPECYLAAVSLDLENLGRQHLKPEAYTTLGLRAAQTILFLLGEESYYRGPSVAGGLRIDPQTIEIHLQHQGGTDFSPPDDISGWQVLDDNQEITIETVQRYDPQTIRIRLAEPISGPVLLRYLYGAMPDSHHPVRDNSAMELPLEPYEQMIP
jgi:hypothetical protein